MITDHYQRLPLDAIHLARDARQRREPNIQSLTQSIARWGVLEPIIVEKRGAEGYPVPNEVWLVAGERRLAASRFLDLPDIPVRFLEDLTPIERAIIELEENVRREDLPWQDLCLATEKIHSLHIQIEGAEWTQTQTAEAMGLAIGNVSEQLRVAHHLSEPRISGCSTVREAYNVIRRRDQREHGDMLEDLLGPSVQEEVGFFSTITPEQASYIGEFSPEGEPILTQTLNLPPPPPPSILCESFLIWAPLYSGPKFSLIHCDFPYGVSLFSGPQGRGSEGPSALGKDPYADTSTVYFDLLDCLCSNLDKLLSISGHLVFWYSETHGAETRETFRLRAPSLKFYKFPLVWHKTDNAGISSDARRTPRHIYETALLASRGDRMLVETKADCYGAPSDRSLHPSCKPEPMLRHFFSMLVDQHTSLLDPTCGAGSSLRAAESLGAERVLGLEISPDHARVAREELARARAKARGASHLSKELSHE